jgi:hypothetical protein
MKNKLRKNKFMSSLTAGNEKGFPTEKSLLYQYSVYYNGTVNKALKSKRNWYFRGKKQENNL